MAPRAAARSHRCQGEPGVQEPPPFRIRAGAGREIFRRPFAEPHFGHRGFSSAARTTRSYSAPQSSHTNS